MQVYQYDKFIEIYFAFKIFRKKLHLSCHSSRFMMGKKILHFLLNKYFLTLLAFVVWLVFFDSNNLIMQQDLNAKLKELQIEKRFYLEEIRKDSLLTLQLRTDSASLERFARERYLMKKSNEDLFLVIDTSGQSKPGQRQ